MIIILCILYFVPFFACWFQASIAFSCDQFGMALMLLILSFVPLVNWLVFLDSSSPLG